MSPALRQNLTGQSCRLYYMPLRFYIHISDLTEPPSLTLSAASLPNVFVCISLVLYFNNTIAMQ